MKTIKIKIDTGELSLGGVPAGVVELELEYLKDKHLNLGDAFAEMTADDRHRSLLGCVAQHAVRSWSAGPLDRAQVERFLVELYDEQPDVGGAVISRSRDREKFGRPKLIDAEELGNG